MHDQNGLKIISVTGAHSDVGKTAMCAMVLKELKGFGAVKFTKTPLYASIVDNRETLMQSGKDTAIMYEAGAEKVIWIKSPRDGLKEVLPSALERMSGLKGLVIEGNSPVDFLNTHLVIFIVGEDGKIKPSSFDVAEIADIIVINIGKRATRPSDTIDLPEGKAERFRIDLYNNEGEINEFISYVKDRIA
jgi:molybdopterin-guanine dinucleotide biosynthesis protein